MNYYSHNIGDYRRDTMHLSLLEHGVYRQLLDQYYLSEEKIPTETQSVFRRLCAKTEEEKQAVETVLNEFFRHTENGWKHVRCDAEIANYTRKAQCAVTNGRLGGRPKKTDSVILGSDLKTEKKPDRKLTNNQEPITNNIRQRENACADAGVAVRAPETSPAMPPTLTEVKAFAATFSTPDCAEAFWNAKESECWIGKNGMQIANWKPLFRNYANAWRANDFLRQKSQQKPSTREAETVRTGIASTAGRNIREY